MGRSWRQVISPDETLAAAGEVVWSWHRDPGATLAGSSCRLRGQERPLPGEQLCCEV